MVFWGCKGSQAGERIKMGELGEKILKLSCYDVMMLHLLTFVGIIELNTFNSWIVWYEKLNQAASKMMPQSHGPWSYRILPISRVSGTSEHFLLL